MGTEVAVFPFQIATFLVLSVVVACMAIVIIGFHAAGLVDGDVSSKPWRYNCWPFVRNTGHWRIPLTKGQWRIMSAVLRKVFIKRYTNVGTRPAILYTSVDFR